jgi:type IV pilus assembly protein PilQ
VGGQGTLMETFGFAQDPATAQGLTVGFSEDNIQAIITALETVTDTTLLANPKILSVNKQEGIVYIGRKIGYVSQTSQTQTSTTQAVEFLETGTRLAFRPYIGDDGYIRMDIYPKDSTGTLKENNIPDETSTELRANVVVKDGETVVIGGLFRDSVVTSRSQVPVLGNLPVLGGLFRGTTDTMERQEVFVILTPHIIEEPSQASGGDRAEDIRRKMEGAKDSMQWFDRARLAEDAYAKAAKFYLEGDIDSAVFHIRMALMLRPTYLEARRLQERIIAETDPEELKRIDSIVEQAIEQQETKNWRRY